MKAPGFQPRLIYSCALAAVLAGAWPGLTRQAQAQDKPALPTLGHDRADRRPVRPARASRRARRADRRRVRLVRRAGLGPERKVSACSRTCRRTRSSSGRQGKGVSVFLKPSGYTGRVHARRRARLERPAHGSRRAGSSFASTATAASPGSSRTGSSRPWPTSTWASGSTVPTTASSSRTATSISPILPTDCSSSTRPGQGARFQRRLPALRRRRHADPADQGDDLPQRNRLLARREDPLRRQFRPEESDLDGIPGQG